MAIVRGREIQQLCPTRPAGCSPFNHGRAGDRHCRHAGNKSQRRNPAASDLQPLQKPTPYFFKCPETSLVISNMLTCFLPLNTALKFSSALIRVRFLASCNPFFLM